MQGDLNFAHPGSQWDYAQPLNRDLGTADNRFEHLLSNSYAQQEHTRLAKDVKLMMMSAFIITLGEIM